MAKIAERHEVLGGRGCVILHASGSSSGSWFYKERRDGRYITKKLSGATSAKEAIAMATVIAFEITEKAANSSKLIFGSDGSKFKLSTARSNRKKSLPLTLAVNLFLTKEQKRVDANIITQGDRKSVV